MNAVLRIEKSATTPLTEQEYFIESDPSEVKLWKKKRFVYLLLSGLSRQNAIIEAGYFPHEEEIIMVDPYVKQKINEHYEKSILSKTQIIQRLKTILDSDLSLCISADGSGGISYLPLTEIIERGGHHGIKKFYMKKGKVVGFETANKLAILKFLLKHHGS